MWLFLPIHMKSIASCPHILDKYPLLELHACGRRADYKDIVPELNEKIAEGILQK